MKSRQEKQLEKIFGSQMLNIDGKFKKELKHKLFKEQKMSKAKSQNNNQKLGSFVHNLKQHKLVPLSAALGVALVIGGVSAYAMRDRAQLAREQEVSLPSDLAGVISIEEIKVAALSDVPGGDIIGVELEQEDGVLYYKIKFADGTYRLYDAKSGEVVINKDGVETDESVPADFVPGISIERAVEIAKSSRPGVKVEKIELESENGVIVYSVRFVDDSRVDVDATNGSVLRVKTDDQDEREDDKSDDDSKDDDSEDDTEDDSEDDSEDDNRNRGGDDDSEDEDDDSNDDDEDSEDNEDDDSEDEDDEDSED